MLTPEDQALLQTMVLPIQDRHMASLLVHGLRTFQAIAAATDTPGRLPDRPAIAAWVALQPPLTGDPGFQEAFVDQLCLLQDPLRTLAAREGLAPLDLPTATLLTWVKEQADARLTPPAATPPGEASSPPPG